jgi:hypothetical protein
MGPSFDPNAPLWDETKRDERGSHPPCWPARKPRSPRVPVVLNRPPVTRGPIVRIHLPPAGSLQTFGPSRVVAIAQIAMADQLDLAQAPRRPVLLGRLVAAINSADPGDEVGRIVKERAATVAVSAKTAYPLQRQLRCASPSSVSAALVVRARRLYPCELDHRRDPHCCLNLACDAPSHARRRESWAQHQSCAGCRYHPL